MLDGVNVALGVKGSIAAVKTVELAHELRRQGAAVRALMTDSARGIIHPWALEYATERDVVTEITGRVEHVDLCGRDGWADVLLIAPATANTVGKIAGAVDDTPVTTAATTALGADVPVVVAPAILPTVLAVAGAISNTSAHPSRPQRSTCSTRPVISVTTSRSVANSRAHGWMIPWALSLINARTFAPCRRSSWASSTVFTAAMLPVTPKATLTPSSIPRTWGR